MSRKITPVLWSRPTKDGERQIYIRLTENRKSNYFTINRSIQPKFWNKEYKRVSTRHPSHEEINKLIDEKVLEVERNDLIVLKGVKGSYMDFFLVQLNHLDSSNKIGTYKKWKIVYNHLKTLLKNNNKNDLLFKDITPFFLDQVKEYYIISGISKTTQRSYFKIIKRVYSLAIKYNVFIPYSNPFYDFDLPKDNSTHKSLTEEEFKRILERRFLLFRNPKFYSIDKNILHTFNFFLFTFFAHGMRFGDLIRLKWENIVGIDPLFLNYIMNKTKKETTVPLYDELIDILRFYLPTKHKLVYLTMTNKDLELFNFLEDHYQSSLLQREFNGKRIKLPNQNFTIRKDFNPDFYRKIQVGHQDSIDRRFLKKLIRLHVESNGEDYVFPLFSKKGENLTQKEEYNYINSRLVIYNRELKSLRVQCGIQTKLSSHISRHSFSDISRQLGTSIYDISVSLNHQDLSTTQNYLDSGDIKSVESANRSLFDKLKTEQSKSKTIAHKKKKK